MKKLFSLIVANIQKYVPLKSFRSGQQTIYDAIRTAIIAGHRTMYIEGPTGMGKSFIQSMIADSIIDGSHNIKVLLLVPKINLLTQMVREFKKFVSHLSLGIVGDGEKDFDGQVTIMTYQSFIRLDDSQIEQYAVILLDEAHKALGPETRQKIDVQTHALIIGFTATASYDEKKNLLEFLKFEVYRISIREAVKVGMLSAIQFILGKVKIEIATKAKSETLPEYQERIGKEIIRQGGNIAAARLYRDLFKDRGIRFIMFTISIKQGNDLVEELGRYGISSKIVHGDMGSDERQDIFDAFARDEFKVLVGIDVIKEGFDDPGVHGVMFVYPINTLVGLIQGAGRATRLDELFPDKVAYIVQLMFEGKRQVFYNDALDGHVIITANQDDNRAEKNYDFITNGEISNLYDDILTSVTVDHEEVIRLVRDYDPLDFFNSVTAEEKIEEIKKLLETKDIVSHADLMRFGSMKFNKERFGEFGKGRPFASVILGRRITEVTTQVLEEISTVLGWSLTYDQQMQEWLTALAEHGITSHTALYRFGIRKFTKTSFGKYGKGRAFAVKVLDNIGKYVAEETFVALSEKFGWKPVDGGIQECKDALAVLGITSHMTLREFGPKKFTQTTFGEFGKAFSFVTTILGKAQRPITTETLDAIAEKLGWALSEDEKIEVWKAELQVHGIDSYETLLDFGVMKFGKTSFGQVGKGLSFTNRVLGAKDQIVTLDVLKQVATKFGWTLTEEQQKKEVLHQLQLHGITSRDELLSVRVLDFVNMSFGRFGKGNALAGTVLGKSVKISSRILSEIATAIGWATNPEEEMKSWKKILADHGITSRKELLLMGTKKFSAAEFGRHRKGQGFATAILGTIQRSVNTETLESIAEKLGWVSSTVDELNEYKELLARNNITSRNQLLDVGPVPFARLSFGDYGKGNSFAGRVLGETVKVTIEKLEAMADKLGWTTNPEEKLISWKAELSLHGIHDYHSLVTFGQKNFKRTVFGRYGKGQAFAKTILGSLTVEHFTNDDLMRVAEKFGWKS